MCRFPIVVSFGVRRITSRRIANCSSQFLEDSSIFILGLEVRRTKSLPSNSNVWDGLFSEFDTKAYLSL